LREVEGSFVLFILEEFFIYTLKDLIMSAAKKDQNPKLRIKLKSYDIRMLEASVGKVISLLIKSGAEVKGPIPLPKKKKIYTVLRSNFKFKKSREQFERISYTRMIDVTETGAKTVEYLQNLSIPVGILVDVKVF
jgi:small subunit ribosomal protein S10